MLLKVFTAKDSSTGLKRMMAQEFDSVEDIMAGVESGDGTVLVGERNRVALEVMDQQIAAGKKRGFSVPVGAAFKGALGDMLLAELGRDVVSEGPVDVGVIRRVLDAHRRGEADFGLPLYTALVYCLWWRRFVVDEAL